MNALVNWAGKIGLTCLALAASHSVLVADDTPTPAAAKANESGIPIGVPCHVHSICGGVRETQFAKIVKVTPEWVVLDLQHEKPPIVAKLPYVGRLYKNVPEPISTGEGDVWVPRSSIAKVVVQPAQSFSISRHRQLGEARPIAQAGIAVDAPGQRPILRRYRQTYDFQTGPVNMADFVVQQQIHRIAEAKQRENPKQKSRENVSLGVNGTVSYYWCLLGYLLGGPPTIDFVKQEKPAAVMPSAYYLRDDVQYFPHGPEFKLTKHFGAIEVDRFAAFFAARSVSDAARQVELERIGIDFDYNDHVEQQRKRTSPKRLPSLPTAKPLPLKESSASRSLRDANASSVRWSSPDELVYQPTARLLPVPYVGHGPVFQTGWRRDPAIAKRKMPDAATLRTLYDGDPNKEEFIHKRLLSDAAYPDFAESIGVYIAPPTAKPAELPPPVELAPPQPQAGRKEAGLKRITLKPEVTRGLWTETSGQNAYVGKIDRVEKKRIRIVAVSREGRSSQSFTLLSEIPFIDGSSLRNTGVGVEALDNKEIWVDKDQVESIEPAE